VAKDKPESEIAGALGDVAHQIMMLGNAGMMTPEGAQFGGLEAHGMAISSSAERIALAVEDVGSAIRDLAEATAKRG